MCLSEVQFNDYSSVHLMNNYAARSYIQNVRDSEASRMVGAHAKSNVCSSLASSKMGRTISLESRGPEKAFFYFCEFDSQVLEFWDQPGAIKIIRVNKKNKFMTVWYTPDFLTLTKSGPCIVEVKSEGDVKKLLDKYPADWVFDGHDYHYLPAERAFSEIGLSHRVFVYSKNLAYKINNYEMLYASRKNSCQAEISTVKKAFENSFFWTLYNLKNYLKYEDCSALISFAEQGVLFFDMDFQLLSEPKNCILVSDFRLLQHANELQKKNNLHDPICVKATSFCKSPNEKSAQKALLCLEKLASDGPGRSKRRWRKKIKIGAEQGLSAFQSLIDKRYLSGDYGSSCPTQVKKFLNDHIKSNYAKKQGLSKYRGYVEYKVDARDAYHQYDPVCWETYRISIDQQDSGLVAGGRGGNRAANADMPPSDPRERYLKSDIPWISALIDHCLAKIYLIYYTDDGVVWVMKPWLSALIDHCSGEVLAFAISFLPPSRHSCCKVIRDCVRRMVACLLKFLLTGVQISNRYILPLFWRIIA